MDRYTIHDNLAPGTPRLNEHQVRRLRITCQHIDELLCTIEETLNFAASKAAFPHYTSDITPVQRKTIEDYIARIRAQLIRVLDGQQIPRDRHTITISRAIDATLISVDIAVEELKPKYMRGYGELPDAMATELNGISGELHSLVMQINRYLAQGAGQDLKERLKRLEQAGNDLALLSTIERIVAEQGLVEFRGTIAAILDRAEDRNFEIAVFGRVSSGKSSLLNAVLGTDVLPVGVTPVTSVPTRITYGENSSLTVSFADRPVKSEEIARLGDYASEQGNPGNAKHVTRITVALPAPRLGDGITFVDTPGLGSLATHGAAETLAYLPKCDLGIVLIDAGSTLTEGDLHTILALEEATVPAHVLLSKADLLSPDDCKKTIQYVRQHIASACQLDLPVHPVSVRPSNRHLVEEWYADQIRPLSSHSQELRAVSLQRKIGALRESVSAALRVRIQRSRHASPVNPEGIRAIEARLRRATGRIEEARAACEREIRSLEKDIPDVFPLAAARVLEAGPQPANPKMVPDTIVRAAVLAFVQERVKGIQGIVETLAMRLQNDLVKSADDLGNADMPGDDEFLSFVRGMPVFDPGTISISPGRSPFAALLGKRFAHAQLADQIRQELGKPLRQAILFYEKVLEDWAQVTTNQLGRRFETYAERYRAQAERSLNGQDLTQDEVKAIEADLRVLGGDTCDAISATFSEPELPDGYP
jgi:GTP-binding protein EngB required for normal cell division